MRRGQPLINLSFLPHDPAHTVEILGVIVHHRGDLFVFHMLKPC